MKKINDSEESEGFEVLKIKVKPDLVRLIDTWTEKLELNESNIVQHCLETGLFLGEMDSLIHKKMFEDLSMEKRLQEVHKHRLEFSDVAEETMKRIKALSLEEKLYSQNKSSPKDSEPEKILRVRVDKDTYDEIKKVSDKLGIEVSTYIRFCIRTGLYLEDLNVYLTLKDKEKQLKK